MERIRRLLRGVLGWDSRAYRLGSKLLGQLSLIRIEGAATARALAQLQAAPPGGAPEALRFARLAHPFNIRPGTKDVSVALNNFVREEYGAIAPAPDPRVLLDGGAYVGDTSAYFLSRYPGLRCVALEPMADSFDIARRNLAPYGDRVELHRAALTADGSPVRMSGVQTGARIGNTGEIEVPSMTIPAILDTLPEGRIDILKLDIEGAEGPIFAAAPETWLDRIGLIVVETHGPDITATVLRALAANGWSATRVRNLYFCRKA
jgi:FkbM family methyltransferase